MTRTTTKKKQHFFSSVFLELSFFSFLSLSGSSLSLFLPSKIVVQHSFLPFPQSKYSLFLSFSHSLLFLSSFLLFSLLNQRKQIRSNQYPTHKKKKQKMADDSKKKLFDAIENGDDQLVKEILQKKEIDIECKNKVLHKNSFFCFFFSQNEISSNFIFFFHLF